MLRPGSSHHCPTFLWRSAPQRRRRRSPATTSVKTSAAATPEGRWTAQALPPRETSLGQALKSGVAMTDGQPQAPSAPRLGDKGRCPGERVTRRVDGGWAPFRAAALHAAQPCVTSGPKPGASVLAKGRRAVSASEECCRHCRRRPNGPPSSARIQRNGDRHPPARPRTCPTSTPPHKRGACRPRAKRECGTNRLREPLCLEPSCLQTCTHARTQCARMRTTHS